MSVLYVCSSGGHLMELLTLHERWVEQYPEASQSRRFSWVCFKTTDAESLLSGANVLWAHHPTNRNLRNLFRNWFLARTYFKNNTPDVVISTGAGVAVPFILQARRHGVKTCYIESVARSEKLSLTGRLLYGRTDSFLVQCRELANLHSLAKYRGQVS